MSAHTPGPFCEQCIVTEHYDLVFCPLHAAAPAVLEALERLERAVDKLNNPALDIPAKEARTAIRAAKAEA